MPFAAVIALSMAGESLVMLSPLAPKSLTFSTAVGPTSAEAPGARPATTARAAEAMTNPRRVLFIGFRSPVLRLADGKVVQVGTAVRRGRGGPDRVVAR